MSQPTPDNGLNPDDLPDLSLVLLGHVVDVVVLQEHLRLPECVAVHFKSKV